MRSAPPAIATCPGDLMGELRSSRGADKPVESEVFSRLDSSGAPLKAPFLKKRIFDGLIERTQEFRYERNMIIKRFTGCPYVMINKRLAMRQLIAGMIVGVSLVAG